MGLEVKLPSNHRVLYHFEINNSVVSADMSVRCKTGDLPMLNFLDELKVFTKRWSKCHRAGDVSLTGH